MSRGRKRKRGFKNQERIQRQRIHGEEHISNRGKGKVINKKEPGPPCKCKRMCFDKVPEEDRQKMFQNFWAMDTYNLQNSYLFGCLQNKKIIRRTKKTSSPSRRSCSILYSVLLSTGERKIVCKVAFLNIHGLQNNRGRVENLAGRIGKGVVSPPVDQRGKHDKHPKKFTPGDINEVKCFIEKLPKYTSHYSRNDNLGKVYMSMEYTIDSCYTQYKDECIENGQTPVSCDKFRRIFTEDFNISFKTPKMDTCSECDSLNIAIKKAQQENDGQNYKLLRTKQELHHRKSKAGQDMIKTAAKAAQGEGVYAITFDLQQALPTPKLSTGPTFYKKKLFCYNLSVHSCKDGQGYFYFWDESTAGRGADEIGSCLLKHFEQNNITGDKLIAITDNCAGQNKNWTVVSVWLRLIASGRFKNIEHVFPQVGHTMLPSDRDFAIVEKYVRSHCQFVYSPDNWISVLKSCQKKKPFVVYHMKQEDFFDVSSLRAMFSQKTTSASGNTLGIRSAVRLMLSSEDASILNIADTYNGLMTQVSLKRKGRPGNFLDNFKRALPLKYDSPRPIEETKLRDVLSCMQWIPAVYHPFYNSLK